MLMEIHDTPYRERNTNRTISFHFLLKKFIKIIITFIMQGGGEGVKG